MNKVSEFIIIPAVLITVVNFRLADSFSGATVCENPGDLENGQIDYKLGNRKWQSLQLPDEYLFTIGDRIRLSCNEDFHFRGWYGDLEVECEETGEWSWPPNVFGKMPRCHEWECNLPPTPKNGYYAPRNQNVFKKGESVTYKCETDYRRVGPATRICNGVYGWTGVPATCSKGYTSTCPRLDRPENGDIVSNELTNYYHESVLEFQCHQGYKLIGSAKRMCQENGRWSGTVTRCDNFKDDCPNPGIPDGGKKTGSRYNSGNTVIFECNQDFVLRGDSKRTCLPSGQWTGEQPTCIGPGTFDFPQDIARNMGTEIDMIISEGNIKKINRKRSRKRGRRDISGYLSHTAGFQLIFVVDTSASISKADFDLTMDLCIQIVEEIRKSPATSQTEGTDVAVLTYNDDVVNQVILDTLNLTEIVKELKKIKGKITPDGGTGTNKALKEVFENVLPLASYNKPDAKRAVFLFTDGFYNVGGDPLEYTNKIKTEYQDVGIFCFGITENSVVKDLEMIASSPAEKHMFYVSNFTNFGDVAEKLKIKRDYTLCGQAGKTQINVANIIGGTKAHDAGSWPWVAALFFGNKTNEKTLRQRIIDQEYNLECGSSLIHKDYLLTAAHCLTKLTSGKVNSVIAVIGNNDFSSLGRIRYDSQMFEITKSDVILHEDYSEDSYINDIAVMRLPEMVAFSVTSQMVCLPPQDGEIQAELYTEDLEGRKNYPVVTGWGAHQQPPLRYKPRFLRQLQTPLLSLADCQEYTLKDTKICAGILEQEGKGACHGDSGGPLVRQIEDMWYLIGVVSSNPDKNCADGKPTFYTRVDKYLDWIEEKKEELANKN